MFVGLTVVPTPCPPCKRQRQRQPQILFQTVRHSKLLYGLQFEHSTHRDEPALFPVPGKHTSDDGPPLRGEVMPASLRPNEEPTVPAIPPMHIRALASLTMDSELCSACT